MFLEHPECLALPVALSVSDLVRICRGSVGRAEVEVHRLARWTLRFAPLPSARCIVIEVARSEMCGR